VARRWRASLATARRRCAPIEWPAAGGRPSQRLGVAALLLSGPPLAGSPSQRLGVAALLLSGPPLAGVPRNGSASLRSY